MGKQDNYRITESRSEKEETDRLERQHQEHVKNNELMEEAFRGTAVTKEEQELNRYQEEKGWR